MWKYTAAEMSPIRVICLALSLSVWQPATPAGDLGASLANGDLTAARDKLASELTKQILTPPAGAAIVADPRVANKLAVWKLIAAIGPENLTKIRASADGTRFLRWLAGNPRALEDYLSSGDPSEYNGDGLTVWKNIWAKYPESRSGALLRFAEACGLTFALSVNYSADGKPVDPMQRFAFFVKSYRDGALFPYFEKALTWELRYVAASWVSDEEMVWVRGRVPAAQKNQQHVGDVCVQVPYRATNSKGVSVQDGPAYYDHRPVTLQLMVEVGGVCGAISFFGSAAAQSFGIPAMWCGQPGHCAFTWRDRPGSWALGYNIFGWAQSTGGLRVSFGTRPVYVWLIDAARSDPQAFTLSERLRWASALFKSGSTGRLEALRKAAEKDPANLPAVREFVTAAKAGLAADAYVADLQKASDGLKDSPYAVSDLVRGNMEGLLKSLTYDSRTRKIVGNTLQAIADGNPTKQLGCAPWASSEFMTDVLRVLTRSQVDFGASQREGKDAADAWDKLDGSQQMTWLRGLEMVLKSDMKRKDLYEQPLTLYATLLIDHSWARVRGIPELGAIAREAVAAGATQFGADASRKLAEICGKAGDMAAADKWRKTAGP